MLEIDLHGKANIFLINDQFSQILSDQYSLKLNEEIHKSLNFFFHIRTYLMRT